MKLKYNILWFEDDEEVINDKIGPSLQDFLKPLGFTLHIAHYLNGEKLEELLRQKTYDLIVTDLNLGEFETGEVLIDQIRNGDILTEVLLYSANTTEIASLIETKGWIERASFCVGLANLLNKLETIIFLTIRKNQDVNNIRGLVIAETIELEKKIELILLRFFEAADNEVSANVKEGIRKSIYEKKVEKNTKDIEKIEKIKFSEIKELVDNDILTATNTYESVLSILKMKIKNSNLALNTGSIPDNARVVIKATKEHLENLKANLVLFKMEVIDIRNILAHVEERTGEDGIPFLASLIKGHEAIKFDSAKYSEVRKNLHKHNEILDEILTHIVK
ncbi:MAG TPA: response regulator [Chitinophagaceae bacterium]|nr:response regulator [Chitinophagaceae bacterium]